MVERLEARPRDDERSPPRPSSSSCARPGRRALVSPSSWSAAAPDLVAPRRRSTPNVPPVALGWYHRDRDAI